MLKRGYGASPPFCQVGDCLLVLISVVAYFSMRLKSCSLQINSVWIFQYFELLSAG